jgi:hypothetical protein
MWKKTIYWSFFFFGYKHLNIFSILSYSTYPKVGSYALWDLVENDPWIRVIQLDPLVQYWESQDSDAKTKEQLYIYMEVESQILVIVVTMHK